MYEVSSSEDDKEEHEYRVRVNSEDDSIVDAKKANEPFEKSKDTPLGDTSLKDTGSDAATEVDPFERK
jgi:hypothetical protein